MADFADYGIRLYTHPVLSWAEFRTLTTGLLAGESRLWRALKPPAQEESTMPGG